MLSSNMNTFFCQTKSCGPCYRRCWAKLSFLIVASLSPVEKNKPLHPRCKLHVHVFYLKLFVSKCALLWNRTLLMYQTLFETFELLLLSLHSASAAWSAVFQSWKTQRTEQVGTIVPAGRGKFHFWRIVTKTSDCCAIVFTKYCFPGSAKSAYCWIVA